MNTLPVWVVPAFIAVLGSISVLYWVYPTFVYTRRGLLAAIPLLKRRGAYAQIRRLAGIEAARLFTSGEAEQAIKVRAMALQESLSILERKGNHALMSTCIQDEYDVLSRAGFGTAAVQLRSVAFESFIEHVGRTIPSKQWGYAYAEYRFHIQDRRVAEGCHVLFKYGAAGSSGVFRDELRPLMAQGQMAPILTGLETAGQENLITSYIDTVIPFPNERMEWLYKGRADRPKTLILDSTHSLFRLQRSVSDNQYMTDDLKSAALEGIQTCFDELWDCCQRWDSVGRQRLKYDRVRSAVEREVQSLRELALQVEEAHQKLVDFTTSSRRNQTQAAKRYFSEFLDTLEQLPRAWEELDRDTRLSDPRELPDPGDEEDHSS
jgi:hypothetical protein